MDFENIKSASTYVNNLLLARGLLKNAEPIDFAQPEKASGGAEETLARIINLVNDLIIKRDDRLARRNAELARSLALAQGQERVFKATIKSAETTTRKLKEQMQKLKASVQQIRAQAATDIRKKDVELSKLKSHLSDRQRGKRDGPTVITITGGAQLKQLQKFKADEVQKDGGDAAYSLKPETNEYLSRLCRELSDENDTMAKIVKNTIHTLKDLQGGTDEAAEEVYGVLGGDQEIPQSRCNILADEIANILNSLRDLLTNSSYVPLEEVEARDEEILRLREGWEKMEARWEEALKMMDKSASNDNNRSVPKGGLTRGTKRKAEAQQTVANSFDVEIGRTKDLASDLDGKRKENAAPRRNLETEGRTLRPRLTMAAPNALREPRADNSQQDQEKTKIGRA
ncbi:hypothetical protein KEM56_007389 [Ascosphaera pollenicola]|nr:hypothetical protein KEM56_007389 [Ascosphaera pollenicola]